MDRKLNLTDKSVIAGKDSIFSRDRVGVVSGTTYSHSIEDKPAQYTHTIRHVGGDGKMYEKSKEVLECEKVLAKQVSDYNYPAYRRLGKIFGAKIIDEIHLIANLDSQKGNAVYAIYSEETWGISGTISRGYVTDI